MRLHTNTLAESDIYAAMKTEQDAGRIAPTVRFKILNPVGSRSHARAFEVQLESTDRIPGDGRRVGNSGSYGAMSDPQYNGYAATYDEWGWLLAALYRADPDLVCGTVKHPTYADADDFHTQTAMTYALSVMLDQLEQYGDPYPYIWSSPKVGRYGAGRSDSDRYGPRFAPRDADWYRSFAKLDDDDADNDAICICDAYGPTSPHVTNGHSDRCLITAHRAIAAGARS